METEMEVVAETVAAEVAAETAAAEAAETAAAEAAETAATVTMNNENSLKNDENGRNSTESSR
jgi:hypothetical protein